MEHEGSLPRSQKPATIPYPVPDVSSLHHHTLFLQNPFQYYITLFLIIIVVVVVVVVIQGLGLLACSGSEFIF
jgi:hypothetical protein